MGISSTHCQHPLVLRARSNLMKLHSIRSYLTRVTQPSTPQTSQSASANSAFDTQVNLYAKPDPLGNNASGPHLSPLQQMVNAGAQTEIYGVFGTYSWTASSELTSLSQSQER